MAHQPSEHQPEHVEPDPSPDVLQYSENTTPGSPERRHLEARVAELGWSNLFELLPPGVAEAYEVICADLTQLADELTYPSEDQDEQLRSLGTYIRTLHRLDQYRDEFGIWWGFPPDTRKDLHKLAQHLRTESPLTPNQIERLLERWSEVDDESVAEFIELVENDEVAVLNADGGLSDTADAGPESIRRWALLGGGDPATAVVPTSMAARIATLLSQDGQTV